MMPKYQIIPSDQSQKSLGLLNAPSLKQGLVVHARSKQEGLGSPNSIVSKIVV